MKKSIYVKGGHFVFPPPLPTKLSLKRKIRYCCISSILEKDIIFVKFDRDFFSLCLSIVCVAKPCSSFHKQDNNVGRSTCSITQELHVTLQCVKTAQHGVSYISSKYLQQIKRSQVLILCLSV